MYAIHIRLQRIVHILYSVNSIAACVVCVHVVCLSIGLISLWCVSEVRGCVDVAAFGSGQWVGGVSV